MNARPRRHATHAARRPVACVAQIQPELNTNADGVCCSKDKPFTLKSGVCTAKVAGGHIS